MLKNKFGDSVEENDTPGVSQVHHHQAHSVSVIGKINDEIFKCCTNNEEDECDTHMNPNALPLSSPSKNGRAPVCPIKVRVLEILKSELHSDATIDSIELAYSSVLSLYSWSMMCAII